MLDEFRLHDHASPDGHHKQLEIDHCKVSVHSCKA